MPTHIQSRRRFLQSASFLAATTIVSRRGFAQAANTGLIVRTAEPYNAEPPLAVLVANGITPVKHFYVRNHGPMPRVDSASHRVKIGGLVQRPMEISLGELKQRFRGMSTEATLTCAGNRRQEMSAIKPVGGVQWDAGAIGHARWTGASLKDVLEAAGIQESAKHVWFEGLDPIKEKDGSEAPFGGSIPLEKAMAIESPPLLAFAMNDEPLTAEHGSPLRTIVPGYIGARSVKWLSKITVSDRPSPNHYVAEAYKLIQSEDKEEVARAEPIYTFPVNAAICSPSTEAKIAAGKVRVSGYALASGQASNQIAKVEVTRDGQVWTRAELTGESKPYSWQHWTAELELPPGKHNLVVRATDARNSMPQRPEWNLKGYLYNGWHRVSVEAV